MPFKFCRAFYRDLVLVYIERVVASSINYSRNLLFRHSFLSCLYNHNVPAVLCHDIKDGEIC